MVWVRLRFRVRVMVRVGVNPYPNPNHKQSEESYSNQSEARIPDLSYEKKYRVPGGAEQPAAPAQRRAESRVTFTSGSNQGEIKTV